MRSEAVLCQRKNEVLPNDSEKQKLRNSTFSFSPSFGTKSSRTSSFSKSKSPSNGTTNIQDSSENDVEFRMHSQYELLEQLGSGSFGIVQKARPRYPSKTDVVAIKSIKIKPGSNPAQTAYSEEVMFLLKAPRHKNIVQMLDCFMNGDNSQFHVIMEFMEQNLYQLMVGRRGKKFSTISISSILFQIMEGIEHIHLCGYFHRDIKPENILVTTRPQIESDRLPTALLAAQRYIVKIADFGLIRKNQDPRPLTGYVSTRWYRAPELLLRSQRYCQPIDIFAWGCVAYEIAHLKPLFPGKNEAHMLTLLLTCLGSPGRSSSNCMIWKDEFPNLYPNTWDEGYALAEKLNYEIKYSKNCLSQYVGEEFHGIFLDLLERTLRWNPDTRPTATQCLHHPYFDKLRLILNMTPSFSMSRAHVPNYGATSQVTKNQSNHLGWLNMKQKTPRQSARQSMQIKPTIYDFSASVHEQIKANEEPQNNPILQSPVKASVRDQKLSHGTMNKLHRSGASEFLAAMNNERRQSLPGVFFERNQPDKQPINTNKFRFSGPLHEHNRKSFCNYFEPIEEETNSKRQSVILPLEHKKGRFSGIVSQLSSIGRQRARNPYSNIINTESNNKNIGPYSIQDQKKKHVEDADCRKFRLMFLNQASPEVRKRFENDNFTINEKDMNVSDAELLDIKT